LILSQDERNELIENEPGAKKYINLYTGGDEFLNNIKRYCLWLKDAEPVELRQLPEIMKRIKQVKEFRNSSNRQTTRKLAATPALFGEDRQPLTSYVLIPKVSSENRRYIPMGIVSKDVIANGSALCVPNATKYELGVLMSEMHMAWMRYTAGRLESRFQYSNSIVYNNFPWPESPSAKQKEGIEAAVKKISDIRSLLPGSSLADLYDPLSMPPALVKAHQELDKATDLCYRPQPFMNETKRIEFLFELYDKYTSGLFKAEKKSKRKSEIGV
jgi:hypothetical protein